MSKWVSVNDRLPDKSGDYLVFCCNHNFVTISYFRGKTVWAKNNKYITHWMPLPEPPKGCKCSIENNVNGFNNEVYLKLKNKCRG